MAKVWISQILPIEIYAELLRLWKNKNFMTSFNWGMCFNIHTNSEQKNRGNFDKYFIIANKSLSVVEKSLKLYFNA